MITKLIKERVATDLVINQPQRITKKLLKIIKLQLKSIFLKNNKIIKNKPKIEVKIENCLAFDSKLNETIEYIEELKKKRIESTTVILFLYCFILKLSGILNSVMFKLRF